MNGSLPLKGTTDQTTETKPIQCSSKTITAATIITTYIVADY